MNIFLTGLLIFGIAIMFIGIGATYLDFVDWVKENFK
jgi:hypothetical protein